MKYVLCFTTINNAKIAERLARELVQSKLVACVNILPQMTSVYSWKNKIESDHEYLLIMKTKKSLVKKLEKELIQKHPYELPEFVVLPIEGSKKYLDWISKSTA